MNPRKNKNDYTCIIFGDFPPFKMAYVHNIYSLVKWLERSKYSNWMYINIYLRRTGEYLVRQYPNSFVNPKP